MRVKALRTFMGPEGFVKAGAILSVSDQRGAALIAKGYVRAEESNIATRLSMPAERQESAAEPAPRPLEQPIPLSGIRIGVTGQRSVSPLDQAPETPTYPSSEDGPA